MSNRARSCSLLLCALLLACAARALAQDDAAETSDEGEEAQSSPEEAAPEPHANSELNARLSAGAGIGMRNIAIPSSEGWRNLDSGVLPEIGVRVAGRYRNASRFLGLRLSYETSVHARASDQVGDHSVVASEVGIRSHRFEAGLLPGLLLSQAPGSGTLALFAGYNLRAFGSVETLRVPRFTLHGPSLRIELSLPLFAGLRLRLAPEAQLVLGITQGLRDLAGLGKTTFAFGGEVDLQARLSKLFAAQLSYRESHLRSAGLEGKYFSDAERYVLLELIYQVE